MASCPNCGKDNNWSIGIKAGYCEWCGIYVKLNFGDFEYAEDNIFGTGKEPEGIIDKMRKAIHDKGF